jgi:hypothetical protein
MYPSKIACYHDPSVFDLWLVILMMSGFVGSSLTGWLELVLHSVWSTGARYFAGFPPLHRIRIGSPCDTVRYPSYRNGPLVQQKVDSALPHCPVRSALTSDSRLGSWHVAPDRFSFDMPHRCVRRRARIMLYVYSSQNIPDLYGATESKRSTYYNLFNAHGNKYRQRLREAGATAALDRFQVAHCTATQITREASIRQQHFFTWITDVVLMQCVIYTRSRM